MASATKKPLAVFISCPSVAVGYLNHPAWKWMEVKLGIGLLYELDEAGNYQSEFAMCVSPMSWRRYPKYNYGWLKNSMWYIDTATGMVFIDMWIMSGNPICVKMRCRWFKAKSSPIKQRQIGQFPANNEVLKIPKTWLQDLISFTEDGFVVIAIKSGVVEGFQLV